MASALKSSSFNVQLPSAAQQSRPRELAERAGVSKQSVTRIEIGMKDPRFSTITALNEAIRGAGVEMAEDVNLTISTSSKICGITMLTLLKGKR